MKRLKIIIIFLIIGFSAYCQSYEKAAASCFEKGDYSCAREKYTTALQSAKGKQKQIIEIKLSQAIQCLNQRYLADQAFNNKNYKSAKERYQNVLASNPKDEYAKIRLNECIKLLNPINLSVSDTHNTFSASGGTKKIKVNTNASSFHIGATLSWYTVVKHDDYIIITCKENTSSTKRSDYFRVNAGDKYVNIHIQQSNIKASEKLIVSNQYIYFDSEEGHKGIDVNTNADSYQIESLPTWCSVSKNSSYFILHCAANKSNSIREGSFIIKAGSLERRMYVKQNGRSYSKTKKSYSESKQTDYTTSFNDPKAKYTWGITAGYIERANNFFDGLQLGLRIEPLFKYGFGLNTGILFEIYSNDLSTSLSGQKDFTHYGVNIPMHFEYRFNFSKWFNFYVYGGVGLNFVEIKDGISYLLDTNYVMPLTYEYGGGLRINHVQFNIGQSTFIRDMYNNDYSLMQEGEIYQRLILSISYMF